MECCEQQHWSRSHARVIITFSFINLKKLAPQFDGKLVVAVPEPTQPALIRDPRGVPLAQADSNVAHNLGQLEALNTHASMLAADERLGELSLNIQGDDERGASPCPRGNFLLEQVRQIALRHAIEGSSFPYAHKLVLNSLHSLQPLLELVGARACGRLGLVDSEGRNFGIVRVYFLCDGM